MQNVSQKIEKKIRYQILVFSLLMLMLWVGYFFINSRLDKRVELVKDDFSWIYQIDLIEENDGDLYIAGWAFCLNQNAEFNNYDIVLYNVETGETYFPKMKYVSRQDVNNYFFCEFDYTNSGFVATISLERLDIENEIYEILLKPEGERKSYQTNVFYGSGEMMFVNPNEFVSLETDNEQLKKVIDEGVLRVYRPDYGMYVYQYDEKLYWIANDRFSFETDKNTYIQYHLYTTQNNKLPEHRLVNDWFWDNMGFWFEEQENIEMQTDLYRVTVSSLPDEYSITKIITGYYSGERWEWRQYFRPWYEFK